MINTNYFWEKDEFITGDNLEDLADYVFDIENFLVGDHGRIKTSKSEQQLIDEQISELNDLKPNILYVYGHDIKRFLPHLNRINNKFVLITHNSDLGILDEYIPYVEHPNIIKWFGQNNYIKHPKVISLPIGIARSKYQHGNVELLSNVSKNKDKQFLVYKNFSIDTNRQERLKVDKITNDNGIFMLPATNHTKYLDFITKSVFTISPPGNGVDCHRIWESLYLKTIPVVQKHKCLEQFEDLPILFIDSWNDVTIDFLRDRVKYIDKFNQKIEKLSFNYWKNLIKNL
jgi:hypothetical protein